MLHTQRAAVPCVSCAAPAAAIGPLPGSNVFAGRSLDRVIAGGTLYRCTQCALGFRHPRLAKDELDRLYASGAASNWEWSVDRRNDWTLASRYIRERCPRGARVLDVGCFDGAFLASLGGDVKPAGVEIMPEAARRAAARGVEIIGHDFACIEHTATRYDAITAFDVIEHVDDPRALLQRLARVLAPGGIMLISTGNLDAWTWRMMGSRYWYCTIPEHIAFVSARWFEHTAPRLGLRVSEIHRYAHARVSLRRHAFETFSNMVFLVAPRAIAALRRRGYGNLTAQLDPSVQDGYPPGWASAKDHFLVALQNATPAA